MMKNYDYTATAVINLREFKEFVRNRYSHDSPFYQVIVAERDEIPYEEYAAKFLTWLKLIRISVTTAAAMPHHQE